MKEWDMVKFILFASLFLCLLGMGLYGYQVHDRSTLETEIPRCRIQLTEIGRLSAEVEVRKSELDKDVLGKLRPQEYVERQAHDAGISYRQYLEFNPLGEKKNDREGYVDRPYEIVPVRKKKFDRRKIAKFIFNLEAHTNRLKVTKLSLNNPNEQNYEEWNMNLETTIRSPLK